MSNEAFKLHVFMLGTITVAVNEDEHRAETYTMTTSRAVTKSV